MLPLVTRRISITFVGLLVLGACSSVQKASENENDKAEAAPPISEMRTQMGALNARIEELEGKLTSLNGKLESMQAAASTSADRMERSAAAPVIPHPATRAGAPISISKASSDPEAGFMSDDAIQSYRKALVLLQSQQHSESVLAFSNFLEQYPDHPLAGSAQFYVGEAYFQQKEYKLALQEYRRVLTSYDRSAQVPEALHKMALAEDLLNMKEDAKAHRQLLTSLYPQSPAAGANAEQESTESSAPRGLDGVPPTAPLKSQMNEPKRENAH